jgi:hypothetical protein
MTENTNAILTSELSTNNSTTTTSNQETNSFDFNSFVSDDLKTDPDFERITNQFPKDPKSLIKDYYNKFKHFGKAKEVVKAELEAESKNFQYKPEEYSFDLPTKDYQIEKDILETAKQKAIELGIKPEQAKGLINEILKKDFEITSKIEEEKIAKEKIQHEENQKIIEGLKTQWGFDYEKRLDNAEKTFAKFTSPEESLYFASLPMNAKIPLIKMMDSISSKISEGTIGTGGESNNSLASIDVEIEKLNNDNTLPDYIKHERKQQLYQKRYLLERK